MPTMGKLVAAVLFGALAWYVSQLCIPIFPEGTMPTFWTGINTGFGILMGWVVAGKRAGMGLNAALSYGVTTAAAIIFWALFGNSAVEMVERSLDKRYDGPVEAVVSIFEIGVETGQMLATAEVLGALFIGSIIAALIVEFVGKRAS
ncbi:TrgA family protein [Loktanella sp. IMCC34160]|uniref:TrgA family protein n=1 Tax=Loktanella sp. IMCC34160 TaxID=2510646 RepID=UPI00101D2832|nr:TrgA family protein [Loktanella sp. IMCC34160]RYG91886.1 TrgA family protein [Loktanella sp. IMCC34160]